MSKGVSGFLTTAARVRVVRSVEILPRKTLNSSDNGRSVHNAHIAGGTKRQTSKLEHTQTNSPSMHFRCENTNSFVIRMCHFLTIYLNFCENTNSFLALLKVLFIKAFNKTTMTKFRP